MWVIARQEVGCSDDAVCWLFVFLLFYAIWPCMLSVQCIISQTAIDRATAVLRLCWLTQRHWTYELAYREQHLWVGQRLRVRKTAIGQLWPLTDSRRLVYYDLNAVRLGRPACRSVQSSQLGHHGITSPLHLLMDMARKYIDLYTYIYIYMCVYVHT